MNLRLLQLGDSALPIGGYSQSWGLEAAIDRGLVRDAFTLEQWLRFWLRYGVGPLEGVVVAAVCRAVAAADWVRILRANELLWASLAPPTLRNASRDMGEQLLALAEAWPWAAAALAELREQSRGRAGRLSSSGLEWHHAPVFGVLASAAAATPVEALSVYFHQSVLGGIGAGVRAIPIGHTHGQQILARLHDDLHQMSQDFADRDLETAGSFCPAYEMLCHAQNHLYTRLFRS
jgi:urease accessory protein